MAFALPSDLSPITSRFLPCLFNQRSLVTCPRVFVDNCKHTVDDVNFANPTYRRSARPIPFLCRSCRAAYFFFCFLTRQPCCQVPWRPISARSATRKRWHWNAHPAQPSLSNTLNMEERECTASVNATRPFFRWSRGTYRRITHASGRNHCRYVPMKFSFRAGRCRSSSAGGPVVFRFIKNHRSAKPEYLYLAL